MALRAGGPHGNGGEAGVKVVARQRQTAEPDRRGEIVLRNVQRASVRTVGLVVVGDVSGLARALCERVALTVELRCREGSRLGGIAARENASEQEGSGGDNRRCPSDEEPLAHYGFCWPFVLSKPLNGSA